MSAASIKCHLNNTAKAKLKLVIKATRDAFQSTGVMSLRFIIGRSIDDFSLCVFTDYSPNTKEEKELACARIREEAAKCQADYVITVMGVWTGDERALNTKLSENPNRGEAVVFVVETPGTHRVGIAAVNRKDVVTPTFGKLQWDSIVKFFQFGQLLPQNYVH